jgi:hypothetical protein
MLAYAEAPEPVEMDAPPVEGEPPAKEPPAEAPPAEEPPAEESPAEESPATKESPAAKVAYPIAPARPVREASRPVRKRKAAPRHQARAGSPARTPSPPLSYLEVMTRAMAAARVAERDAKSARYDAFFQRR